MRQDEGGKCFSLTSGHDHEAGPGGLEDPVRPDELEERVDALRLARHLDNDGITRDVDELAAKLLGDQLDPRQVLVLLPERFRRTEPRRVRLGVDARVDLARRAEGRVGVDPRRRPFLEPFGRGQDIRTFVGELVHKVLGAEDRDLGEQQFALDRPSPRVVENRPHRDLCARGSQSARGGRVV